jgi:hypothetical protein
MVTALHFAESAFPLHLLLERLQRLIDVVIANENLYQGNLSRRILNTKRAPALKAP